MEIIQVYKCLCDVQRLRILNLLQHGPLCVCHLVEILESDQVKISKQLRYMKELGMVEGERFAQWMIYSLTDAKHPLLRENLKCLQDCYAEDTSFAKDLRQRAALSERIKAETPGCAEAICDQGCQ
ncbi:ArsR/SmtB family transcription factor [Cerasicoccus arenae]|nr:metalloregulator ArsR/SmtB family transcription factor [Cerasicoccus arenae]MBK1858793.1 winged helix-turn-helix transcriptional regulator [Cerasicoccus arenae]